MPFSNVYVECVTFFFLKIHILYKYTFFTLFTYLVMREGAKGAMYTFYIPKFYVDTKMKIITRTYLNDLIMP